MSDYYKFNTKLGSVVYINIKQIYSVERGNSDFTTRITSTSGAVHIVDKHIEEVLAILEERDMSAASILFGSRKK